MVDVSGIPNMGFGGGGYFGGSASLGLPAMSADQINASMWGNYSPGAAQSTLNNIYGGGGFGSLTDYYSALGASYGRETGGFGGYGAANADPFTAVGGGGGYPGATTYPEFGYGGGGQYNTQAEADAAAGYNAPRQYGWGHNEGAPYPTYQPQTPMGEFRPHTYGWDHNEGAPVEAQPQQQDWESIWYRALPLYMPQMPPSSVTVPGQQSSYFGMNLGGMYNTQAEADAAAGYDIGAQSRAYQSPLQGFDWAQSYGTAGGANAAMLRAAGGASPGYYNPQLDWLSQSMIGMNNQPVDYSHMFGMPGSGYLGSQSSYNQDPFGGYVNPQSLDAGGSFPLNYQPSFGPAQQGFRMDQQ